ncbi:iron-sulfur cluster assembly accessory protein [Actinoallomurus sp. NPDC050550]|uniref:HesB/IscA family protein n=1 Tax=Actinoallomurus sp. NPDC050550 TaxID=3154937 RepID=UPI0033F97C0E
MTETTMSDSDFAISLTDAAVAKAQALLAGEEDAANLALRVGVEPGGCAGLRYQLYFDELPDPAGASTDTVLRFGSLPVLVSRRCHKELNRAVIDHVNTLAKQGFVIDNPNATGGCACGDSYH